MLNHRSHSWHFSPLERWVCNIQSAAPVLNYCTTSWPRNELYCLPDRGEGRVHKSCFCKNCSLFCAYLSSKPPPPSSRLTSSFILSFCFQPHLMGSSTFSVCPWWTVLAMCYVSWRSCAAVCTARTSSATSSSCGTMPTKAARATRPPVRAPASCSPPRVHPQGKNKDITTCTYIYRRYPGYDGPRYDILTLRWTFQFHCFPLYSIR